MKKKALIIGGSGGLSGRLAVMAQKEYDVWVLTRGKRPLPGGVHPLTADRNDPAAFLHALTQSQNLQPAEATNPQPANWDVVFD